MKKAFMILMIIFMVGLLVSPLYAGAAVDSAKTKLKQATDAYVAAKQKLSDAQIKSVMTVGKQEKQDAVKAIKDAKKEVITTKKVYKAALHELKKAEVANDSNIDRTPWR